MFYSLSLYILVFTHIAVVFREQIREQSVLISSQRFTICRIGGRGMVGDSPGSVGVLCGLPAFLQST